MELFDEFAADAEKVLVVDTEDGAVKGFYSKTEVDALLAAQAKDLERRLEALAAERPAKPAEKEQEVEEVAEEDKEFYAEEEKEEE